jgi:hypothetical protein
MWQILKSLLVQGILAKTVLRSFGWLAWLLPVGFLLKFIGLPLLGVLGVLALPVLVLLFVIGLPVFVVLMLGGLLMAVVGTLLSVGIAVAKVVIPIALLVMLVNWFLRDRSAVPAAPADGSATA